MLSRTTLVVLPMLVAGYKSAKASGFAEMVERTRSEVIAARMYYA
jgi:hypothetical protein